LHRRDGVLFFAGADRAADSLQAADGLAVSIRIDLQHRLRFRLRARADRRAGAADPRGPGDDRQPAQLAPGVVGPDRRQAQGRASRKPNLDRLCARERHRLPHLHRVGTRPLRRAVLQLPARANAESATRRTPHLAEGRIPGLNLPNYSGLGSRESKLTSNALGIVGQRTRLFPDTGPDIALDLVESRSFPKGIGRPAFITSTVFDILGSAPRSFRQSVAEMGERMGGDRAWLFGRRTYEQLLASWNARGGPFKDALNNSRKYVASSNPAARLDWPNSTLLHGDVPAAVADLKQNSSAMLVIMGSGVLIGSLMAADLIDEYLLMIAP